MACGSCGTKPGGCKSNGGCSSGGCNRLNVHNWLSDMPDADFGKPYNILEISFNRGSRKDFFKNNTFHFYEKGDLIAVEGANGFDVGTVSLTGELVKLQMNKRGIKENSEEIKKILRLATPEDIAKRDDNKLREPEMLMRSRAILRALKLDMKLSEVEMQADGKKATFYYIAEDRIDYRELIKVYANDFKVKVEMKQIGIRQEAGKVGGIGSCGRELCCSTWLSDFKGVSTVAARYQNLSINQTKLSGQCGRLKCCLNFELDTYMDALKGFPDNADKLEMQQGIAFLAKKDIFKNVMWYNFAHSTTQYPLSIERVKAIKELNSKGIKPENLEPVELDLTKKGAEEKEEYQDLVGAITLKSLDKGNKNNRNNSNNNRNRAQGAKPTNTAEKTGEVRKPNPNQNKPNPNQNKTGEVRKPNPNQNKPNPNQNKPNPNQNKANDTGAAAENKPNAEKTGEVRKPNPNQNRPNPNQNKATDGGAGIDNKTNTEKTGEVRKPNPNQNKPNPYQTKPNTNNGAGKAGQTDNTSKPETKE
jgi:cell fate regulator YaaT (PSP1 superfamily)